MALAAEKAGEVERLRAAEWRLDKRDGMPGIHPLNLAILLREDATPSIIAHAADGLESCVWLIRNQEQVLIAKDAELSAAKAEIARLQGSAFAAERAAFDAQLARVEGRMKPRP